MFRTIRRIFAALSLLGLSLSIAPPPAGTQTIPGVPDRCCGYRDCRRAKTSLISFGRLRSTVTVDGRVVEIPSSGVHWSSEGWYCGWDVGGRNRGVCPPGAVNSVCAICVVIPKPALMEFREIPQVEVLPVRDGRQLLIPMGRECGGCHR